MHKAYIDDIEEVTPLTPPANLPSCNIGGITVTADGSLFLNYAPQSNTNANCTPNAVYSGIGAASSPWSGTGFITYTFSAPVISARISYSIFDRDGDFGTITTNSCGNLQLTNPCGLRITGNLITGDVNPIAGNTSPSGNVGLTVSSNQPFTSITFTDDANSNTLVQQGNLCNFILTPFTCNLPAPILSATTLSNICPSATVNLAAINASNTPIVCSNLAALTWHNSPTASASTIISAVNNVGAGTYYASFYDAINNCYSPTTPVTVTINGCTSDVKVVKSMNSPTLSVGSNVTFTIIASNLGPGNATNVVVNDILPSGYTFVSATSSLGTWTAPNWTIGNLANGSSAVLNIIATVKQTGNYTNTATVTASQTDPVPSNNSSSVTPNIIYAVSDNFTSSTISTCTGGITASVLSNDLINGIPLTSSQVSTFLVNTGGLTGVIINNLGVISVSAGNPSGTYTVTYGICQTATGLTTNCSQATVLIKVGNVPIIAVNDNFSTPQINTLSGGQTNSVLTNDTINGIAASSTNVYLYFVSASPPISPTPTINSNGNITIPAGTTVGTYTIVYKIAQAGCISNFTTASVTVVVNEQTIITPTLTPGIRANNIVSLSDTQADGKIIIAGYFTAYNNVPCYGIARLMPDLTLDPTFNIVGPLPLDQLALDLKVIRNTGTNFDKILVVGNFDGFNGGTNGRRIIRLTKDGNVVSTFNTGALAPGTTLRGVSGSNSQIRTCYVYPDLNPNGTANTNAGKILLGGMFGFYNGYEANKLVRLTANGDYETGSFNTNINTILTTAYDPAPVKGFSSSPDAIAVQSNGDVILGGWFKWYNGQPAGNILRINNLGVFDTTFNTNIGNGITYTNSVNPRFTLHISKLLVLPDNSIMVGGEFSHFNNVSRNNITKLLSTGAIDYSFSVGTGFNNGIQHYETGTYGMVRDFAYEPYNPSTPTFTQGRLYVGGDFSSYNGTAVKTIMRINLLDGANNTFSVGTGPNGTVWTLKRQGDGKIIVGGQFTNFAGTPALNITRLAPSGAQAKGNNLTETYISEPQIDLFEDNEINNVIIYPNPNNGIFNVVLNNFIGDKIDVKVYSSIGQIIYQKSTIINDLKSLNLSELPKGNYFISFSDGIKSTRKIITIK